MGARDGENDENNEIGGIINDETKEVKNEKLASLSEHKRDGENFDVVDQKSCDTQRKETSYTESATISKRFVRFSLKNIQIDDKNISEIYFFYSKNSSLVKENIDLKLFFCYFIFEKMIKSYINPFFLRNPL